MASIWMAAACSSTGLAPTCWAGRPLPCWGRTCMRLRTTRTPMAAPIRIATAPSSTPFAKACPAAWKPRSSGAGTRPVLPWSTPAIRFWMARRCVARSLPLWTSPRGARRPKPCSRPTPAWPRPMTNWSCAWGSARVNCRPHWSACASWRPIPNPSSKRSAPALRARCTTNSAACWWRSRWMSTGWTSACRNSSSAPRQSHGAQ